MSRREKGRFTPKSAAAFRADLFGELFGFFDDEPGPPFELVGDCAIVSISGPLDHHDEGWWDSYDAISERFDAALASPAANVLLRIDSPGGMVSGCYELSASMRMKAAAMGKRLVAYADGMACSGGYALACAAPEVYAPPTATIGSIGVLVAYVDLTPGDEKWGEKWTIIASGTKKTDGHPHVSVSPEAAARAQAEVDELAGLFFDLVASARGISAEDVKALEAGCLFGAGAKAAGLINDVKTMDQVLAMLAGGSEPKETTMGWKDEMKKAADEGDEEAKKCLENLEEDPPAGDKDKEKSDEEETEGQNAAPEKDPADKDKSARLGKPKTLAERVLELEENETKRQLIASRPDLPANLRAELASQPLATVRFATKQFPRVKAAAATPAATPAPGTTPAQTPPSAQAKSTLVGGTRGKGADFFDDEPQPDEDEKIDRAMGLSRPKIRGVEMQGNVVRLGTMKPEEARARLAELEAREVAEAAGKKVSA